MSFRHVFAFFHYLHVYYRKSFVNIECKSFTSLSIIFTILQTDVSFYIFLCAICSRRDRSVVYCLIRHMDPASAEAQALVKKLQDYITEHMYTCTKEILSGLGKMYAGGGDFTRNIDSYGGEGTAEFASQAIELFCR